MTNPFDDIEALILGIPAGNESAAQAATQKLLELARPTGNLGQFDAIPAWYAQWGKKQNPQKYLLALFAATHGLTANSISPFQEDMTTNMVAAYGAGGGTINQLCSANALGLQVFELALEAPTQDISKAPALSPQECAATFAYGMESLASEPDILGIGCMSIGGNIAAAAIFTALYGGSAKDWLILQNNTTPTHFENAAILIEKAIALHKPNLTSPLKILQYLGGREFAAIAGAIIAARYQKVPVVIDGVCELAVAAILYTITPHAISHIVLAQNCGTNAHKKRIESLNLSSILSHNISLNEGASAALTLGLIRSVLIAHNHTFSLADLH